MKTIELTNEELKVLTENMDDKYVKKEDRKLF